MLMSTLARGRLSEAQRTGRPHSAEQYRGGPHNAPERTGRMPHNAEQYRIAPNLDLDRDRGEIQVEPLRPPPPLPNNNNNRWADEEPGFLGQGDGTGVKMVIPAGFNLTQDQVRQLNRMGIDHGRPFNLSHRGFTRPRGENPDRISSVRIVRNLGTVHTDSIVLTSASTNSNSTHQNQNQRFYLRFTYSADTDMTASILFAAKDVNNKLSVRVDLDGTKQWEHLLLPAGTARTFNSGDYPVLADQSQNQNQKKSKVKATQAHQGKSKGKRKEKCSNGNKEKDGFWDDNDNETDNDNDKEGLHLLPTDPLFSRMQKFRSKTSSLSPASAQRFLDDSLASSHVFDVVIVLTPASSAEVPESSLHSPMSNKGKKGDKFWPTQEEQEAEIEREETVETGGNNKYKGNFKAEKEGKGEKEENLGGKEEEEEGEEEEGEREGEEKEPAGMSLARRKDEFLQRRAREKRERARADGFSLEEDVEGSDEGSDADDDDSQNGLGTKKVDDHNNHNNQKDHGNRKEYSDINTVYRFQEGGGLEHNFDNFNQSDYHSSEAPEAYEADIDTNILTDKDTPWHKQPSSRPSSGAKANANANANANNVSVREEKADPYEHMSGISWINGISGHDNSQSQSQIRSSVTINLSKWELHKRHMLARSLADPSTLISAEFTYAQLLALPPIINNILGTSSESTTHANTPSSSFAPVVVARFKSMHQKVKLDKRFFRADEIFGSSFGEGEEEGGVLGGGGGGVDMDDDDDFQDTYCCICLSSPRTVAMYPCRHLCMCEDCATALQEQQAQNIAINRENARRGTRRPPADEDLKCPMCRRLTNVVIRLNHKSGHKYDENGARMEDEDGFEDEKQKQKQASGSQNFLEDSREQIRMIRSHSRLL